MSLTIVTDHEGDFDDLDHEFTMRVRSDDDSVDETWIVKLEIISPEDFEAEIFWGCPLTGERYAAAPLDALVADEIQALIEGAVNEAVDARYAGPVDPWAEAGVSQLDFL